MSYRDLWLRRRHYHRSAPALASLKGRALQTAYSSTVHAIEAKISALDTNAPDYDAQRSALEAQETAAGTTQQACLKKAQSS